MHDFQIVDRCRYPVVIGNSILQGFAASLNYGRRCIMQGVPVETFRWDPEVGDYVEVESDVAVLAESKGVPAESVSHVEMVVDTTIFR